MKYCWGSAPAALIQVEQEVVTEVGYFGECLLYMYTHITTQNATIRAIDDNKNSIKGEDRQFGVVLNLFSQLIE